MVKKVVPVTATAGMITAGEAVVAALSTETDAEAAEAVWDAMVADYALADTLQVHDTADTVRHDSFTFRRHGLKAKLVALKEMLVG